MVLCAFIAKILDVHGIVLGINVFLVHVHYYNKVILIRLERILLKKTEKC